MGIIDMFRRLVPRDLIADEMEELARRREEGQRKAGIYHRRQRSMDLSEMDDPEKAGQDIGEWGIASTLRKQPAVVDDQAALRGFEFLIDDVFAIAGRGTVVTGSVIKGTIRVGDDADLVHHDGKRLRVRIIGIKAFRKKLERVEVGENAGILLRGIPRGMASRGDQLVSVRKG